MSYTVLEILQARILEWVAFPFSRESSQPRCPTLQVDSLPVEPQGKPKNTGVGSLSLLQQIFPTQKSNWGLLHCRWILYQLSYQGSPSGESWRKILPAGGKERTTLKCAETSVLLNKVCSEEKLSSQGLAYLGEGKCQLQATLAMLSHLRVGSENREAPVKGMVHQLTKKLRPDSRIVQPFCTPNLTLTSLKVC